MGNLSWKHRRNKGSEICWFFWSNSCINESKNTWQLSNRTQVGSISFSEQIFLTTRPSYPGLLQVGIQYNICTWDHLGTFLFEGRWRQRCGCPTLGAGQFGSIWPFEPHFFLSRRNPSSPHRTINSHWKKLFNPINHQSEIALLSRKGVKLRCIQRVYTAHEAPCEWWHQMSGCSIFVNDHAIMFAFLDHGGGPENPLNDDWNIPKCKIPKWTPKEILIHPDFWRGYPILSQDN